MPTTLNSGLQLPDKGSVDWYGSMQTNYNLLDTHLENTDIHVTAEDKANWDSKQGSLSQSQLDAIAQVATNTDDIATLQSGKANTSHTHSSSDITDIGDYATKQYVDNSISGLVDNAPAALDTLKELSTALNDDANFASTVTTALSAKANSADLATVATSGSYTDLSNKPTIPTVNDATLTIQKNGTTVNTFTANASSNVTANIIVPTKTSDLTNDSNFVDTSNSAVASGITSAKVTDYDTHIADTDIHVTTADKTKWNNGVSQSYVFRYSSTALTASSTNSNALLDNTDNLKVGDKVIDSNGVLFSVTAIDIANSTFTIGTALIDLAQDSNVVHKSGNETISGDKVWTGTNAFQQNVTYQRTNLYHQASNPCYILKDMGLEKGNLVSVACTAYPGLWQDKNSAILGYMRFVEYSSGRQTAEIRVSNLIKNGTLDPTGSEVNCGVQLELQPSGAKSLIPEQNNDINLGTSTNKWKTLNGVEPSSLSLPDLTNAVDISGYITDLTGNPNVYSPPANGYIAIRSTTANVLGIVENTTGMGSYSRGSNQVLAVNLPVVKNSSISIYAVCSSLSQAKFIPCQGNV